MKEVANDINIAPASLSRYLSGKRDPDLEYVVRMSEYFGVSIDWLLGVNGRKFDVLPPEIQEFAELYALASPDDRRVVKVILEKYADISYKFKSSNSEKEDTQ
jgi:transcriptional regulator with XRE-family HTH domain